MGMGYGASFTETIEEKSVKATCPEEFKALMQAIKEAGVEDIDEFAHSVAWGDEAEDLETGQCYKELCDAFKKKTGLWIGLGHHDSQSEGDRYDEVDGYFWAVDDVYEKTQAAKDFEALGHKIQRKFFVHFG